MQDASGERNEVIEAATETAPDVCFDEPKNNIDVYNKRFTRYKRFAT